MFNSILNQSKEITIWTTKMDLWILKIKIMSIIVATNNNSRDMFKVILERLISLTICKIYKTTIVTEGISKIQLLAIFRMEQTTKVARWDKA